MAVRIATDLPLNKKPLSIIVFNTFVNILGNVYFFRLVFVCHWAVWLKSEIKQNISSSFSSKFFFLFLLFFYTSSLCGSRAPRTSAIPARSYLSHNTITRSTTIHSPTNISHPYQHVFHTTPVLRLHCAFKCVFGAMWSVLCWYVVEPTKTKIFCTRQVPSCFLPDTQNERQMSRYTHPCCERGSNKGQETIQLIIVITDTDQMFTLVVAGRWKIY